MEDIIALIGNPNTGKTSLYNSLTHSFEHVGNWHGVTVDLKSKPLKLNNKQYLLIDLPGIYSLSKFSFEEGVSIEFLFNHKNATIINLCDANNLNRNLYLTLQLLEAGFKPNLFINFCDELKKKDTHLDLNKLSTLLGVNVYKVNANKKQSVKEATIKILNQTITKDVSLSYIDKIDTSYIESLINPYCKNINLNCKFCALKVIEYDEDIIKKLSLPQDVLNKLTSFLNSHQNIYEKLASLRYEYIDYILSQCIQNKNFVYGKYKIDKIILNRFLALPIFLLILGVIFFITFSSVGNFLSEFIKTLINDYVGVPTSKFLIKIDAPLWIIDLVSVCIINGVGGLLSFLPQIVLLFLFLSILEDSGYLSRLAFSLEDIFKKVGLSGKSIFTLLMGFGCATTAVMTSRNLEDKNSKIKTAIITPYMSCSAKLPLYAVLGGTFFGAKNVFLIFLLYIIGLVVSLTMSVVLEKTVLKGKTTSFMLEFAPYRCPSFKRVAYLIYTNCKQFIIKIGSLIFTLSVIIWILQNFSFKFEYILQENNTKSMLQVFGEFLAPILAPIGLNNWGMVSSLLAGIVAKEMIVSTFCIINNVPSGNNINAMLGATFVASSSVIQFTPLTSFVFMLFSLLYCPCISTISVLHKEVGFKWTLFAIISQFFIAYSACILVFNIGQIILKTNIILSIVTILAILIIVLSVSYILFKFKRKKLCEDCSNCNKKCEKSNL